MSEFGLRTRVLTWSLAMTTGAGAPGTFKVRVDSFSALMMPAWREPSFKVT